MPPEIHTCTLHYTQTLHQNLSQPSIRKPWSIYLQTRTHWHTIEFHEQAILQSRLSSHSHSRAKYSSRDVYDFQLRELGAPPKIWKRCPDSDTAEAEVSKLVKEFGVVSESIGMRRLLQEFGERVRRGEIPVDELFLPPLFLLWLESLNLKSPKTKKSISKSNPNPNPNPPNPPETPLSSHPNFKIHLQVSQIQPGSSQESWIWNETRTFLKLTHHSGPNKSGLYLIPNPYPSSSSSSSSPQDPILFSWTHGSLTTKDNTLYARGKCLTFSPPPQHSSPPPPPVHFHPLPKGSLTPSPHFAASINRSHFSKHWEEYEVDINQPAIPCIWWEKNITILEDGVLLREYEDLYERSKEKGGPQFTPSTFLAQIFHTINTSIPPSKKRGGKNNPPNDDNHSIDISELYERGRQDLERSKQDLARSKRRKYCLRELALSTSSSSSSFSSSSQPPRSQSLPARTRTRTRTKTRIPQDSHSSQYSQRRSNHETENVELRSRSQSCGPSEARSTSKPTRELKRTLSHSHSHSHSPSPNNLHHNLHSPRTHSVPPPPPPPPSRSSTYSSTSSSKPKLKPKSTPTSEPQPPRDPAKALRKTRDLFKPLSNLYAD